MDEKKVRRGYVETDKHDFSAKNLLVLKKAQEEIVYLINRGYHLKNTITFIGNHYMLTSRQRTALFRAVASIDAVLNRKSKEIFACKGKIISIDGFNLIITLETALSSSTLIKCMDGAIRDLAGLRGSYRLIDKTDAAITLIGNKLFSMGAAEIRFYLDAPVSNTGRLKQRIQELLSVYNYKVSVELVYSADTLLKNREYVVTSDAIILNECISWINLADAIISESIPEAGYIDLQYPGVKGNIQNFAD